MRIQKIPLEEFEREPYISHNFATPYLFFAAGVEEVEEADNVAVV